MLQWCFAIFHSIIHWSVSSKAFLHIWTICLNLVGEFRIKHTSSSDNSANIPGKRREKSHKYNWISIITAQWCVPHDMNQLEQAIFHQKCFCFMTKSVVVAMLNVPSNLCSGDDYHQEHWPHDRWMVKLCFHSKSKWKAVVFAKVSNTASLTMVERYKGVFTQNVFK